MITVKDIHVTFGRGTPLEKHALRGVDLAIPEGQFVTVIGSNGAGKSTFLGALAGDVIAERGAIAIDDTDVTRWTTPRRAGLVARVFQDPLAGSCAALTIEENMALAAARGRRRGLGPALGYGRRNHFRDRIAELGLGLEDRLQDRMGLLSGGQRQAVSLLMATLAGSKILLLDEHTAALDPGTASFVLDLTRRIVRENRLTTLMVTHSMRQALDYGDRTVMLHEGRVVLDVSGEQRSGMDVPDLLALFARQRGGEDVTDDSLLIG
jgi:putative ABC transport system ATP-binding protein